MQKTDNLVIVDVAATKWYDEEHFKGAINIPIEELDGESEDSLYMEIPEGRPVLLHCRRGVIVPGAYRRVKELRPDIPEIAYIAGVPPFEAYNGWLAGRK
ncbi:rhodanese-like domain-containing protein [Cloacibacillus porcorum]